MTEEIMDPIENNGGDDSMDDEVILMSDEFSLKKDTIPLLEEHKKRIEELFNVEIDYGLTALEDEMQWVTVSGDDDNRAKARDYARALCNPVDTMSIQYPPALHPLLSRFNVHEKLEKQSRAVILYPNIGTAVIQGNDALSVTLALSSMEDLITKYEAEQTSNAVRSPAARQASLRLESELRRFSSENGTIEYDEDYSKMPDAVKRTILGWFLEENGPEPLESMSALREAAAEISDSNVTTRQSTRSENVNNSGLTVPGDDEPEMGPAFSKYWELGREKGYSDSDITSVLRVFGSELSNKEFLQALETHKKTDNAAEEEDSTEASSRNPMEEFLQNPIVAPKKTSQDSGARRKRNKSKDKKNKGTDDTANTYWEVLTRDFAEEGHEMDIDGFKERSAQRIHLLQQALDLEPVITDVRINHKKDDDEDGIAVDDTDWKVVHGHKRGRANAPYVKPQNSQHAPDPQGSANQQHQNYRGQQQQNQPFDQSNWLNRRDYSPRRGGQGLDLSPRRGTQGRSYSPRGGQSPLRQNRGGRGRSPNRHFRNDRHSPPQHSRDAASSAPAPLRYIIIDGSNVAMSHSNGKFFSCRGIDICVNYFLKRGHKEITVFVPQWRTHAPKPGYLIEDQQILHDLKEKGHLVFTPARRVPGKNIVCYDDRFVIRLAIETDGIIVSNDNYRDLWWENVDYRNIIATRLLPFSFVGDFFMPPDDPLGRDGPHIDHFLTKRDDDDSRVSNNQGQRYFGGESNSNAGLGRSRPHNMRGRGGANFQQMPSSNNRGRGNGTLPPIQMGRGRAMIGQNIFPLSNNQVNAGQQHHFQSHGFPNQGFQNPRSPSKQMNRAWLRAQLLGVFPEEESVVDQVLQRYRNEANLQKLASYVLEIKSQ